MSGRALIVDGDVDTPLVAEYERSRRELAQRGIAVAGTVVAAGAIPFLLGIRNAFAQARDDARVLEAAVGLEQQAAFAYTAAADGGELGRFEPVARLFAEQEQEHADALTRALRDRGGAPPPNPTAAGEVPGLAAVTRGSARDLTRFAVEFEAMAIAAYHDAQARLRAPELLAMAASIMANEAQHLVVLRQALGEDPSPRAFVTGGS
jgi:rubrerythrin